MKKFLLLSALLMGVTMAHATFSIRFGMNNQITSDTTLTVTDFEVDDFDTTHVTMGFKGEIKANQNVTVYIERSCTTDEDHVDQLCAGNCHAGTADALRDTMTFSLSLSKYKDKWTELYSHYYPTKTGQEWIKYTFHMDDQELTLTVNYNYNPTALEDVRAAQSTQKFFRNGRLIIKHNGKEYDAKGNLNHE